MVLKNSLARDFITSAIFGFAVAPAPEPGSFLPHPVRQRASIAATTDVAVSFNAQDRIFLSLFIIRHFTLFFSRTSVSQDLLATGFRRAQVSRENEFDRTAASRLPPPFQPVAGLRP